MYRGTTPTLTFNLGTDVDPTDFSDLWLTFEQGETEITKRLTDCTLGTHAITVTLTQAETLSLGSGAVSIQLRVKYESGSVDASNIIVADVDRILYEGEV